MERPWLVDYYRDWVHCTEPGDTAESEKSLAAGPRVRGQRSRRYPSSVRNYCSIKRARRPNWAALTLGLKRCRHWRYFAADRLSRIRPSCVRWMICAHWNSVRRHQATRHCDEIASKLGDGA